MNWLYANKFGELPSGQAEQVEALVAIAEQLERIADILESRQEKDDNPYILHGPELDKAVSIKN